MEKMVTHLILISKRVYQWFDHIASGRISPKIQAYIPSVYYTLKVI